MSEAEALEVQKELQQAIGTSLGEVVDFFQTDAVQRTMNEMWSLDVADRARFVLDVWLSPSELAARGVNTPPDLLIQRSAFRDDRPTLFCVTKYLPPGLQWQKVTVTIDNPSGPPAISYSDLGRIPDVRAP
jgi:hypothetical protein